MTTCFFVSDLHGCVNWYRKLFDAILSERPDVVFMGGDLLPMGMIPSASEGHEHEDFIGGFLRTEFEKLRNRLSGEYPRIMVILGNDDPRSEEENIVKLSETGLVEYIHNQHVSLGDYEVHGYACVPPTPFRLKDWERYDVSRYVDPGCIPPEEGIHTVTISKQDLKYSTIQKDLEMLTGDRNLEKSLFLFHSPPYNTNLDRVALDGVMINHVPVDVHVGSIGILRFITARQPLITMHGHIHESSRLTGFWQQKIDRTYCFNAAYEGADLSVIRFTLEEPHKAWRELI